jgi:two-component system NarL family response regulator
VSAIRVLVVEDHALFRRGLVLVLEAEQDIELVGEAEDGATGLARAVELAPDVVLMDVRMPRMGGIEATRRLAEELPTAKVVMLTVSDDEDDLFEAIKAGATGYLLKEISIEEVADAVRAVVSGHTLISPAMASKLIVEFAALARNAESQREPVKAPQLSAREIEVLKAVAQGRTNRDIAGLLHISEHTVKNHVRNILAKLHLHSRVEAALYAVTERMVDLT